MTNTEVKNIRLSSEEKDRLAKLVKDKGKHGERIIEVILRGLNNL